MCVFNFTPVPRPEYRVGVPAPGEWVEILNTDDGRYWGSGHHINGSMTADHIPWHGREQSVEFNLPPLAAVYLKPSN